MDRQNTAVKYKQLHIIGGYEDGLTKALRLTPEPVLTESLCFLLFWYHWFMTRERIKKTAWEQDQMKESDHSHWRILIILVFLYCLIGNLSGFNKMELLHTRLFKHMYQKDMSENKYRTLFEWCRGIAIQKGVSVAERVESNKESWVYGLNVN